MINWISFPQTQKPTKDAMNIINAFQQIADKVDSQTFTYPSNKVLAIVKPELERIGFKVEEGKKESEKIHIPVLFGVNGAEVKAFEADAYNQDKGIIIEVEAGRAVTNYQFLKDFYEACMMCGVEYLCIAVRNLYKNGATLSNDFDKVTTFFETMYLSNRVSIPLRGILIIGY